jgi:hypothetical protein
MLRMYPWGRFPTSEDSKVISFLGGKHSELVEISQINDCIVNM